MQILLQGRITGLDDFVASPAADPANPKLGPNQEFLVIGRSWYVTLSSELLPRALLETLGLSKLLLGASSSGQFLLVLPDESRQAAEQFLREAAARMTALSRGTLSLGWSITENLGEWSYVRARLRDDFRQRERHQVAQRAEDFFSPFAPRQESQADDYFAGMLAQSLTSSTFASVPKDDFARVLPGEVENAHVWSIARGQEEAIPFSRHCALADADQLATLEELGRRAAGHSGWGVLRGDVDNFAARLDKASSIEDYVRLSQLYKQFFAGELEVLCSMPDYFRKVTVLFAGGNSFAVAGSWDALLPLAKDVQRIFHAFAENLKDMDGLEGKTLSMAVAFNRSADQPLQSVYEEAGWRLESTKSERKDSISAFGGILEWNQLADAAELVEILVRMDQGLKKHGQQLDLGMAYRVGSRGGPGALERPWRFHWRLSSAFGVLPEKDFDRLRSHLIQERSRRGKTRVRLRPSGQAALQWARLALGD